MSLEDIVEEYEGRTAYPSITEEREESDAADNIIEQDEENIIDEVAEVNEEREEEEQDGDTAVSVTDTARPVKKRIVQNPRVTLNADRICGKRGLPSLLELFEDVKFKGKKHEKEDLDKLMSILELWAHRLMPRLTFDDCLAEIEKLGSKKPVKVFVKKIRLDMPLLTDEYLAHEDNANDIPQQPVQTEPMQTDTTDDIFDRLIREEEENTANDNCFPLVNSSNHLEMSPSDLHLPPQPPSSNTVSGQVLNEEVLKKIEQNRRRAEECRKAKLNAEKILLEAEDEHPQNSEASHTINV